MQDFIYYAPTQVIFGRDAEMQVGSTLAAAGFHRIFIHYGGKSALQSGLLDRIRKNLAKSGLSYVELGGVEPNPKVSLIRKGIEIARQEQIDCILAIGGGSAIDSAKGICLGLAHNRDPWEMVEKGIAPEKHFPLAVVLTIAASGSEMSYSHVVTNADLYRKRALNHDLLRPDFSFENPLLTMTVSPYQTACGVVDIMMHTLERYFTPDVDTDLTDRLAEGLLIAVKNAGLIVMENPKDYAARATLMWASSLSHNGLTGCGKSATFPAHNIEHDISGLHDNVSHGAGLAVLFPAWALYVYQHDIRKFAQAATRVWQVEMDYDHPDRTALRGIEAMKEYFKKLGMPVTMGELGIDPAEYHTLAEMTTNNGSKVLKSYVDLGIREIEEIYALAT